MSAPQTIPDFIFNSLNYIITDVDNNITFISDSYTKLMEYSSEELIGKNPAFLKYPTNHLKQFIMITLDKTGVWNGIVRNKTKSGDVKYFNANIHKNFENGKHIGYYSIHTDITNTIETTHDFIFENEFINLFFSHTDEYVVVCLCESELIDKQIILEISKKLTTMIGLDRDHIVNNEMSFTEIISKNSIYYKNLDLLVYDYEHNPDKIIIEFEDTYGVTRKFKLHVVEFYYQTTNLSRLFTLTDITKELEYSCQLDKIAKSKNNFLASISHDIRTPLSAISGFLTLLKIGELTKDKKEYVDIIQDNTQHLLDLTNDVIDFARMDNKKLEIVYHDFTPKDIQSTIEIFVARGLEKKINFDAFMSPQLPDVMSQDIVRIKQIITNLISNALKFVKEGGTVNIDCSYHNDNLLVIVEDDGIGMSENQIKKVFKPYTQATNKTSLIYGGSGLGLNIVQQMISLMGGSISIDSELEKGSRITFAIPTRIVKHHKIDGKLNIPNISIFDNTFTKNDIKILRRYLTYFTSGEPKIIQELDRTCKDELIFIKASDFKLDPSIQDLSNKNKLIIVKRLIDVLPDIENENIIELSLPILGSKMYNALHNLMLNNETTLEIDTNPLDLEISCKVLVADDLHSNRLLIKELFANYDIDLDLVSDGVDVIEYFNKNITDGKSIYDVIILDMNMIVLDGTATAKQIREIEKEFGIARTPLIALTADRYDTDNKLLVDMDEYVSKPINIKHLLSMLIKYTNNQNIEITYEQSDKLKRLKEIKYSMIQNPNNHGTLIKDHKPYFEVNEYKLLKCMVEESKNKKKLKETYNELMKLIRKSTY